MLKKIITSFVILLLFGCSSYQVNNNDLIKITISDIKINNIVNISSIKEEVNGIVLFSEYGRPNIEFSNTIIGAHSGYGSNAYFNKLSLLKVGMEIELLYNGFTYIYEIKQVYEVNETDTYILENDDYTKLTIITCKIGEINKRIVVDAIYIKRFDI